MKMGYIYQLMLWVTLILTSCSQQGTDLSTTTIESARLSRKSTELNIETTNLNAKEQFATDLQLAAEKTGHSIYTDDMVFVSRYDVFSALTSISGTEFELFAYISLPEKSPLYAAIPADYYHIVVRPPSGIPGGDGSASFRNSEGHEVLRDYPVKSYKMRETRLRRGLHLAVADQKLTIGGCVECSDGIGWCVIVMSIALSP
jgi:hypothetical protein